MAELTGYTEFRAEWNGQVDGTPWALVERVRPTTQVALHERVELQTTVEAWDTQGRDLTQEALDTLSEQLGPLAPTCELPEETVQDHLSVERLFLDVYTPVVDLRVGRQALNWGSAAFINPTDLFAQVLVAQPWQERQGVNAARATVPVGERAQVVGVAALGDDLESWRLGVKPTFTALNTDFSAVGSWDGETPAVGWDLRGTLGVGWWVEGRVDLVEGAAPALSAGMDWSAPVLDRLVLTAQYSYDGNGKSPDEITFLDPSSMVSSDCGAFGTQQQFPAGRHYGLASAAASYEDLSLSAVALMNLEDQSTLLFPQLGWRPGSAWTVNVGAQLFLGEGELAPPDEDLVVGVVDLSSLLPEWRAFLQVRYSLRTADT